MSDKESGRENDKKGIEILERKRGETIIIFV